MIGNIEVQVKLYRNLFSNIIPLSPPLSPSVSVSLFPSVSLSSSVSLSPLSLSPILFSVSLCVGRVALDPSLSYSSSPSNPLYLSNAPPPHPFFSLSLLISFVSVQPLLYSTLSLSLSLSFILSLYLMLFSLSLYFSSYCLLFNLPSLSILSIFLSFSVSPPAPSLSFYLSLSPLLW